jgi:hypothetical protein
MHPNQSCHIEDDSMLNHEQEQIWKKVKIQDSMGKINFFFGTMLFNFWAVLVTWLQIGAPQKNIRKNEFTTHFEQKFSISSYGNKI